MTPAERKAAKGRVLSLLGRAVRIEDPDDCATITYAIRDLGMALDALDERDRLLRKIRDSGWLGQECYRVVDGTEIDALEAEIDAMAPPLTPPRPPSAPSEASSQP